MTDNVLQFRKISGLPPAEPISGLEYLEIVQGGMSRRMYVADLMGFDTYDLSVEIAEGVVDLSNSQVFKIDNKTAKVTNLSFINQPEQRAITVVLVIEGNTGTIGWPSDIIWNNGTAPSFGANVTNVILFWDGTRFTGITGAIN